MVWIMLLDRNRRDPKLAERMRHLLSSWNGGEPGQGQCQVLWLLAVGRSVPVVARETQLSPGYVRRVYADFIRMGEAEFIQRALDSTGGRPRKIKVSDLEAAYREVLLEPTPSRVSLATKMAVRLKVAPITVRRLVKTPEFELLRKRVVSDLLAEPPSEAKR